MSKLKILFNKVISFVKTEDFLMLCIIVLLNIIVRSINLTKNNLWFDEQFSLFWSQFEDIKDVKRVSDWDVVPPGFNLIVHYWISWFGITEFSIRFLSCFAMSLSGGLIYFITKRTFNVKAAIIASVLFLVNTNLFYYSQESRSYACQILLVTLSSWLFILLIKKPNVIYAILLGAVNYYLFYTHFATLFLFFWQSLFALFYFKKNLLNWYVISGGVFLYLLFPFVPRVMALVQSNGQNFWLAKPTATDLITYIEEYFNKNYIGIILLILLLVGLFYFFKKYKSDSEKLPYFIYFFLTGFGLIALSYIESTLRTPLFLKRYVLISNIGVIISISYVISKIPFNKKMFFGLISVILLLGFSTINYNTYKGWNYKRQMAITKALKNSSSAIITDNELSFYYYDIEMFKHITNLGETLNKENIFIVYDTLMLSKIDFSKFNSVIVCNTWKPTNDLIKPVLIKKFPKIVDLVYENDNCKTHIYSK
jgi:uncharacterized membrane protein